MINTVITTPATAPPDKPESEKKEILECHARLKSHLSHTFRLGLLLDY